MPAGTTLRSSLAHSAAVLGPALVTATAALLEVRGITLATIAIGAALLSLLLTSAGRAARRPPSVVNSLRVELGLPAPGAGDQDDPDTLERWAVGAGGRVRELRTAGANLRAVVDATDAPIFATSAAGTIVLCNRAACAFLDRAPEQVVGHELGDFFSQADLLDLHAAARSGTDQRGQVRIPRAGIARAFQVLAAPAALTGSGSEAPDAGVVLTLRDVTELAQAAQLKTDFVANASHELRTPLASIRGAVETLEDLGPEDTDMRARLVRMIGANAERLEDLTRDLLDLSRLESPDAPAEIGPIDLDALIRSVAALLEPVAAQRTVAIRADVSAQVARVESDRRLLTVILRNLVENAVKFSYEGTTVRVVAEPAAPGDSAGLRLRVIDRGIGIPFSHQARIFERFFQGDPARTGDTQARGTGLGLAIVKHAVRTLGGTIAVESVWKEGTTMTVEIPCRAVTG